MFRNFFIATQMVTAPVMVSVEVLMGRAAACKVACLDFLSQEIMLYIH